MAKIISTQSLKGVTEANLRAFTAQVSGRYALLFKTAPTFVRYYSRDLAASRSDANLGGAIEPIGVESPIRYQKVREFPVYGLSDTDLTRAYDEVQGTTTGAVEGETFLLPGTLEPTEGDYFSVEHLSTPLLFKINTVTPERIEGKSFYRVGYFLDTSRDEAAIQPQVTKTFVFELRNFGTEYRAIVEESAATLLRELEQVRAALAESYWRAFYDSLTGSLLLMVHPCGYPVHDRYVDTYVRRNNLFSNDAYRRARILAPVPYTGDQDPSTFEDTLYPRSIYWYHEQSQDLTNGVTTNRVMLPVGTARDENNPLYFRYSAAPNKYAEAELMNLSDGPAAPVAEDFVGGATLVADVAAETFTDVNALRELAKRSLGMYYRPDDESARLSRLEDFVSDLNDSALLLNRPDVFWLLPVLLMEAKLITEANSAKTGE